VRRLLALLLLLSLAGGAVAAPPGPVAPLGHAGRWITDARGRVVILHGINMVYKRPPYAPDATGFGADDAAFLRAEGYDTVRLGVIYKAVEPVPGHYDDHYLARVAATARTLAANGIVSLVDFHQDMYNERFQGEGWPDWAVDDDGLPAEPKEGFSANYLVMPALQRAYDNFFADAKAPDGVGLEEHYAAAWRHVARFFRSVPGVLGYDLLNEPWPGTAWQDCINTAGCPASDKKLAGLYAKVIKGIRSVDRGHLVFYEPYVLFNFGGGTSIGPFDKRAAMSFHDYCLSAGVKDSNAGCDAIDDAVFQHADAQARRTGDGLLLTEFGATTAADILTAMVDRADRFMVGWQEWHYCGCDDPTTSGPGSKQALVLDPARPPRGANLDTGKLAILSRPHPEAVAGTPLAYGYDAAAHRFTLRWTPRLADGRGRFGPRAVTTILIPRRQYPQGYLAGVSGGRVRSPAGAQVLRVTARRGAAQVSVTVGPRS
jgi:endoglycosylceramidase